ncbi:MAG: class I SAM-dependent methyltransferase [Actinobacteria bacterium]|nr:class I SAM-dependent methyltransferase [Actinomycetota bacterium]
MKVLRECNLCGSNEFTEYARKKGRVTSRVFTIVKCQECGLVFVNPRLTAEENYSLYGLDYFKGEGFDPSVDYCSLVEKQDVEKRRESEAIIDKISLFKKSKDIRVLDVGCATGSFVKHLEDRGYENVIGLELSASAGELARQYCRSDIVIADFLSHDFRDEKFDVINATEVIEHVRDPLAFFTKVKIILDDQGLFIYSTGNIDSLYSKVFGAKWPYLNPEGHLFYYSPETLKRYFQKVGLKARDFRDLSDVEKKVVLRSEGQIAAFLLGDVGKNDPGIKGVCFRVAKKVPRSISGRLLAVFVGKYKLPLAFNG